LDLTGIVIKVFLVVRVDLATAIRGSVEQVDNRVTLVRAVRRVSFLVVST
jgi:hypothetical protein